MSNLYAKHCLDYLKKGYAVIPDGYMKKSPLIKGWTKYGKTFPNQEEVTEWCSKYNKSNVAVMLGETSKIVALDVDTNDEEQLKLIKNLARVSEDQRCEKVGSKGFTRFYKYSGEHTQVIKDQEGNVILELLSTGKKTTIPPSIHTSGKPYKWVGKSLLDISVDSLPTLPPQLISTIGLKLNAGQLNSILPKQQKVSGRQSYLGAIASKLISEHTEINAAVIRLIKEDQEKHKPAYFSDTSEFRSDITYVNALAFYTGYLESINCKRINEKLVPELPLSSSASKVSSKKNQAVDEAIVLPSPSGSLKKLVEYTLESSYIEQPTFALSTALSLVGTLGSRKFTFQGATPNIYVLNIADSGSGKDSCQQSIKRVIKAVGANRLLGTTSYPSEASLTANLNAFPVRLDIIDEASGFLQTAANGASGYQAGIGDTLCELFSCSNSHYLGKTLASQPGVKIGEAYRPHVNLICSTTYKGISEALSRSVLEKGLFARFLTFFGENNKQGKRVTSNPTMDDNMVRNLKAVLDFKNPYFTGNMEQNCPAYELKSTQGAEKLLSRYHSEFDAMRVASESTRTAKPIIARLYQQMLKITLIAALSDYTGKDLPIVREENVQFAYQLVRFFFADIEEFIDNNLFDSKRGKQVIEILRLIKGSEDGILSTDLTKYTKSVTVRERFDILRDLVASGQITSEVTDDPNISLFKSL